MASNNDLLRSVKERLSSSLEDSTLLNHWAQVRSKHLLDSVAPEVAARLGYTYSITRLKRVATSSLRNALLILDSNSGDMHELSDSLVRAAEVMEYLADLPDETRPITTRIIAAGLYQLAGYEANSLCIARELPLRPLPSLEGTPYLGDILDRWTVLALRRRFLRLRIETEQMARNREHLEHLWMASADERDSRERLVDLAVVMLATDMYGSLARTALQGPAAETSFRRASEELADVLLTSGRALELLQTRTLHGVGRIIIQNSVWNRLSYLVQSSHAWERYAMLSARGAAPNMLDAASRVELWESQRQALSAGLLDAPAGFSVRMPTSAGKTRIAELAIVKALVDERTCKAIYVAPFRSLADEIEESLTPILADLGLRVSSVLGGFEVDELEAQIVGGADLVVTTPEKLTLLTRIQPDLLRDVGLVILDEGHIIEDRDRGVGYELLLTKLLRYMLPDAKVLFISAVISSSNAADFAEWLCSDRRALIESEWRPARQRVGIYNANRDRISYPLEGPVSGVDPPFVIGAAKPHDYIDYTPKLRREKSVQFPRRVKGEVVAELAINFAKQGPLLVFVTSRGNAESVAQTIQRGLQLRRQTGEAVPVPFSSARDRPARAAIEVASLWLGKESPITTLLADGIGVHHAGLPDAVRKAVESDCRDGLLPVVVATTTLAQGVNLPVKTVIVHSISRYFEDDRDGRAGMKDINPRELKNIIGRAGRAARETEGHVILAAMDNYQAHQCEQLLRRRIPPIRGQLFSVLEELSTQRLTNDRFRYLLDSELITLMVEESVGISAETLFEDLLGDSFVAIQARNKKFGLNPLHHMGAETIQIIRDEVADEETRRVFARTGLDVRSCLTLFNRVVEQQEVIAAIIFGDDTPLEDIITTLVPDLVNLRQMDTRYDFPGDLTELANDWIRQVPMPELIDRHLPKGADQRRFHIFLSDLFGFKMPWGIGAYVAIAKHVLDAQHEASEVIRWLPTMIRYGVSTPSASWAMTLGCPSRELSAIIAAGFASDAVAGSATYSTFVTWFSLLTEEDFTYRFDATSHESELLTRRSAALVPSDRTMTSSLRARTRSIDTSIAGIRYNNRATLLAGVNNGDVVKLVRDYRNQYDPNSIEIRVRGELLGYVTRTEARLLAPRLDAGATTTATVLAVDRNRSDPKLRVRVYVKQFADL